MQSIDLLPFLAPIAKQYLLDPAHEHGLSHWARVLENGLRLAEIEGGDITVISLFAIFHDACRHNQSLDPGHGSRGAGLAKDLLASNSQVRPDQLDLLMEACRAHTDGKTKADLTVQICWDADRLDLARAGITPRRKKLCTSSAKENNILDWANSRALSEYSPPFVDTDWVPIFVKK
jgi:uncharacterized protein